MEGVSQIKDLREYEKSRQLRFLLEIAGTKLASQVSGQRAPSTISAPSSRSEAVQLWSRPGSWSRQTVKLSVYIYFWFLDFSGPLELFSGIFCVSWTAFVVFCMCGLCLFLLSVLCVPVLPCVGRLCTKLPLWSNDVAATLWSNDVAAKGIKSDDLRVTWKTLQLRIITCHGGIESFGFQFIWTGLVFSELLELSLGLCCHSCPGCLCALQVFGLFVNCGFLKFLNSCNWSARPCILAAGATATWMWCQYHAQLPKCFLENAQLPNALLPGYGWITDGVLEVCNCQVTLEPQEV